MDKEVRRHNQTTSTTASRLSLNDTAPESPESTQLLDHELQIVRGDMASIGSAMELSQARLLNELSKAQEEIDRKSPPLLRQELDHSVVVSPSVLNSRSVNSRLELSMTRKTVRGHNDMLSSPLKGDHRHSIVAGWLDRTGSSQYFGTPFGKGQTSATSGHIDPYVMGDEESVQDNRSHYVGHLRSSSSGEAIENNEGDGSSDAAMVIHPYSTNSKGIVERTVDSDEEQSNSSSELNSLLQAAYLELNACRAELAASESCNEELKNKSAVQAQEAQSMLQSFETATSELKLTHEMLQSSKKQFQEMHCRAENTENQLMKCKAIGRLLGSTVLRSKRILLSAFYSWSRSTVAMRYSMQEKELQVPSHV